MKICNVVKIPYVGSIPFHVFKEFILIHIHIYTVLFIRTCFLFFVLFQYCYQALENAVSLTNTFYLEFQTFPFSITNYRF
jgi:hypothetical protein